MKRKHVIKLTLLLLCVSSCYHRHIPVHSPDYVNYNCPYVFSDGAIMCVSIDAKDMDLVLDISFKEPPVSDSIFYIGLGKKDYWNPFAFDKDIIVKNDDNSSFEIIDGYNLLRVSNDCNVRLDYSGCGEDYVWKVETGRYGFEVYYETDHVEWLYLKE